MFVEHGCFFSYINQRNTSYLLHPLYTNLTHLPPLNSLPGSHQPMQPSPAPQQQSTYTASNTTLQPSIPPSISFRKIQTGLTSRIDRTEINTSKSASLLVFVSKLRFPFLPPQLRSAAAAPSISISISHTSKCDLNINISQSDAKSLSYSFFRWITHVERRR